MLERTVVRMNEVLQPITFVLAYPTVLQNKRCRYYGRASNAAGAGDVPLIQIARTCSVTHPDSYSTCTGVFPKVKRPVEGDKECADQIRMGQFLTEQGSI
jgi:hypothetical protein